MEIGNSSGEQHVEDGCRTYVAHVELRNGSLQTTQVLGRDRRHAAMTALRAVRFGVSAVCWPADNAGALA